MRIDLGEMYRASRERISDMVSDDVADVPVRATPAWTVHDLVAHVTGVVTDALAGNTAEAATDPWTAAQAERSRDRTAFEIFRGRLGRRTADEVRSYGWSADPNPYLDAWFIFGQADQSLGEMA